MIYHRHIIQVFLTFQDLSSTKAVNLTPFLKLICLPTETVANTHHTQQNTTYSKGKKEVETQEQMLEPCPKGIVSQLLNIAKENNAMGEIGSATSWRWQEGLISRMPKKRTVAAILRKAYGTNDPKAWLQKVDGDLKRFIRTGFATGEGELSDYVPEDLFEAAFLISITDGRGATREELIFRFSDLKFYNDFQIEAKDYEYLNDETVLNLNGIWAEKKLDSCLEKFNIPLDENGFYKTNGNVTFDSSEYIYYSQEIFKSRHSKVTNNSIYDMWQVQHVALSDEEMIEIEYKLIEMYKEVRTMIGSIQNRKFRDENKLRTRGFSLNSISYPSTMNERLK